MIATYTHSDCLQNSYKINWRIRDVLGDDQFDKSRHWHYNRALCQHDCNGAHT